MWVSKFELDGSVSWQSIPPKYAKVNLKRLSAER